MAPVKAGSGTDRAGHDRLRLLPIAVFGLLLAGCAATAPAEANSELFEQYEVVTGTAKRQTVLAGFFLGGALADLIVVHIGENDGRHLQMYGFDGGAWVSVLEATLRPGVLFVDVANIGGRDRLMTYESGHLNWFDPDSTTERALVEIATHYDATEAGEIPHLDITRDLNRDGRDDLVVPDIDGFWISTQLSDGSFTDALQLGPPEPFRDAAGLADSGMDDSRSYGEVGITPWTLPLYLSRVHEVDYNQDGRSDLVFWNEDHFDVYTQDERGLFDPAARTFTVDVPFDSEGVYSRAFDFSGEGALSLLFGFNEKTRRTVLHSFRDLNGDQVADLVTLTLSGRSLLRQRSRYEVHFGTPTPEGIMFARDVSTAIQRRGKAAALQPWGYSSQRFQDFDGDGDVDIMFRDVKVGIGGMSRAIVGKSVAMDLELYRCEDGIYPDEPTNTRKIRPALRPFSGRKAIFFPAPLMGDVNGDGRADLLVAKSREELHVFLGVPGPSLLARQPQKLAVGLPADQDRNVWLVDLNEDAKQDLLVYHPSTTEPHRLITLIAR